MQIYHTLFQKYRFIGILLLFILFVGKISAQDVEKVKAKPVNITIKVIDESGSAVANAFVVVGEGVIHKETDLNGSCSIFGLPDDFVTVTAFGYEKSITFITQLIENNVIKLVKAKLFMTSDDVVELPFMSVKKRKLTGSAYVIDGNLMDKYPSTDIRNALTGLAPGLEVRENLGMPGMSAEETLGVFGISEKINVNSRGLRMKYIIDGIPTEVTEMPLDPSEIASLTVIKDIVAKSMFGPAAADGIILIKTKRGKAHDRIINVNIEKGISVIDRFPEFVSGGDYARLNNTARTNSGLEPLYSDEAIAAYDKNDPYDMVYPSVNYRDMMLKNSMAYNRANMSSSGGNDIVQYYTYLGYSGEGDIYKIGAPADYNRINTRANIDIKINDVIKVQFDFFGGLSFRRSPNYGFDAQFTSEGTDNPALDIVEFGSVINEITSTPPIAFPVYANNDPSLDKPWYGVSSNFKSNPIGNLVHNGYYTESGRTGAFNVALDFDLDKFVKGLKSKSYIGFNAFNLLRIGKAEDYSAYIVTPAANPDGTNYTLSKITEHNSVDQANQAKLHDFYFQRFVVYETLNYERKFGKSDIQASGTYYLSKILRNGIEEPERQQNGILTGIYSYDDKYNIQGVLNYSGSSSYSADARNFLSPTVGASWIISEEGFMKGAKFINYLKLRAEAGILGYESFSSPFAYRDRYNYNTSGSAFGPHSTNQWFGSSTDNQVYRTSPNRTGNPLLDWEKRREFSVGLDALMLGEKLSLEVNYYDNVRDGMVSTLTNTIPYVVGISGARPRANFNKIRYFGLETGLTYSKRTGDFKYSIGGNATIQNSEILKYDEAHYRYPHQSRIGAPLDSYWGQIYLGKFATDADAMVVPQLYDDELHAGDLQYKDMNNDGVVDDNDASNIGHTSPRLFYSLNIKFSYKNFDFTAIGTGRAFYDIALTSQYHWNGWGDNSYSKFVKDNIGGRYPKLTYYRVNNNFVGSDFWLEKGGFFKIQNVEVAYNVPVSKMNMPAIRAMRIFVHGSNLLTFSKIKDVDPESIYSGVEMYPLFKTFTAGLKLTF